MSKKLLAEMVKTMTRKKTTIPNQSANQDAIDKGEENLDQNENDDDEDENLDDGANSDHDDDSEDTDDENDSDSDDDDDSDDEMDEEELARQFEEEHGFPPRTPEKDLTPEQQLAFNRYHKKKWEKKFKNATKVLEGVTVDEVERLRGIETAYDELLKKKPEDVDTDKLVADAKATVTNKLAPLLVTAKVQTLTEGRVEEARIKRILGRLNISDFISADGDFDEDAISELVEDFFSGVPVVKKSRTIDHQGNHQSAPPKQLSGLEAGRQAALARLGKKPTN